MIQLRLSIICGNNLYCSVTNDHNFPFFYISMSNYNDTYIQTCWYGKIDNLHAYYDGNQLQKSGNFAADTLSVERTTDENGTFIIEKSERYE